MVFKHETCCEEVTACTHRHTHTDEQLHQQQRQDDAHACLGCAAALELANKHCCHKSNRLCLSYSKHMVSSSDVNTSVYEYPFFSPITYAFKIPE